MIHRFLPVWIAGTALATSVAGAFPVPESCTTLSQLNPIRTWWSNHPSQPSTVKQWIDFELLGGQAIKDTAVAILQSYFDHQWSSNAQSQVDLCLNEVDRVSRLESQMQSALLAYLRATYQRSATPKIRALSQWLDSQADGLFPFRVYGHFQDEGPDGKKGGFHRGNRSIFLDFAKIPPEEIAFIFAHEITHAMDPILALAQRFYADQNLLTQFKPFLSQTGAPAAAQTALTKWVRAGLDRGLLAEHRAWITSFEIYLEGKDTLWPAIGWAEDLIKVKSADESIEHWVFGLLDPHFTDPTEGIFGTPLLKAEVARQREELRRGH